MTTRRRDVGDAAGPPAKATRGKQATSSTATRTARSRQSTNRATPAQGVAPETAIVSSGLTATDQRVALEALRDILAACLVAAEPSVAAQIAGQLRAVYKDLAALPATDRKSIVDELAGKRKARRAEAKVAVPAAGDGQ